MSKNKKNEDITVRNFEARDMVARYKIKRIDNDRGNRRVKDTRNSWKNGEW